MFLYWLTDMPGAQPITWIILLVAIALFVRFGVIDKFLKFNIRLLISYIIVAICTGLGFEVATSVTEDELKLVVIVGTFIISSILSFGGMCCILRFKKKPLVRNKYLSGLCAALLGLCLIIGGSHLFAWFTYKDVISRRNDLNDLRKTAYVENLKYYVYGFIDGTELYKLKVEPEALEKIAKRLRFVETDNSSLTQNRIPFLYEKHPPYWWNPRLNPELHKNKLYKLPTHYGGTILYDLDSKIAYIQWVS